MKPTLRYWIVQREKWLFNLCLPGHRCPKNAQAGESERVQFSRPLQCGVAHPPAKDRIQRQEIFQMTLLAHLPLSRQSALVLNAASASYSRMRQITL